MKAGRKPKLVIVGGVTASIPDLARSHGVKYSTVLARMHKHWTLEEALGIVSRRRKRLPLESAWDNLCDAISGEITAEEYLRREGVPENGFRLSSR